ncbi:MAG: PKD domain-containing protein [Chitinophagaceae bacterium]
MAKKLFFIILLALAFRPTAFARHIKGGWIYYECLGNSQTQPGKISYRLTLKLYRDCNEATPGQNPDDINFTIFRTADNVQVTNVKALKTSEYNLRKGTFSNCINPKPNICYIIFEYATVVDLDPIPGGYTVSFQRCCRIDGIVNLQQPSQSQGITYTITIPGTSLNAGNPYNSSPRFAERDTALTCVNSSISLDYSATDPDGDKLVYEFAPALGGSSQSSPSPTLSSPPPYSSVPYAGNYNFQNPFGTNMAIDRNTGIITGQTPSITGEYVLAVIIREYRNGQFLAQTRKELHVFVAGCTLVAADLPPKLVSCDDFSVLFENQSISSAVKSYFWDFGVPGTTTDTSSLPAPTYTYPDTGTFRAKLVVNRQEECSDSAYTNVIVYPGFKPAFSVFGSCIINPFRFTDNTTSRYGIVNKWTWDFGEPTVSRDTSTQRNPAYTYPSLGTKNVSLTVEDSKGCVETLVKPLEVLSRPPLNLAFKDTLICSIDTLQLIAGSAGTYVWTPNFRILNRFTATPLVYPQDTMTYYVTVTDGGCTNSDSVKINVLDFITVDAGKDTTICRTDSLQLRPVSQGLQYQWTPIATLNNPNLKFPIARPGAAAAVYYVTANLGKCQARDSVTITTIPYPGANAGADTSICFNTMAALHGSIMGATFGWSPANILSNATTLNPTVRLSASRSFVLTVFDVLGCPKPGRDTVLVNVLPPLKTFAGNDTSVVTDQQLVFQLPDIPLVTVYRWSPPFGLSNPSIHNPTLLITREMLSPGQESILYTLTTSTAIGCKETDNVLVKVFITGPSIFVPSGFTPNGDGKNDVIRPILAGMRSLDRFDVYNRLGQLVFSTKTIDKGWDGKIKGEPQPASAFVYNVQATDYLGKVIRQAGTFVLIR